MPPRPPRNVERPRHPRRALLRTQDGSSRRSPLCDGDPSLGTLAERSIDLAYVLRRWGRHVEAARAIDRVLAAADDDPDVLSLGALIAVDRRDPAQAERLLRKLGVLRAPTRSDTFAWAAVFSALGRHDEAAEVLKNLPAAAEDADLDLISIQCDLARGRPDEAERRCRDILARHPDHALALANLAVACSMQDRREEARALNARAIEVDGGTCQGVRSADEPRDRRVRPRPCRDRVEHAGSVLARPSGHQRHVGIGPGAARAEADGRRLANVRVPVARGTARLDTKPSRHSAVAGAGARWRNGPRPVRARHRRRGPVRAVSSLAQGAWRHGPLPATEGHGPVRGAFPGGRPHSPRRRAPG